MPSVLSIWALNCLISSSIFGYLFQSFVSCLQQQTIKALYFLSFEQGFHRPPVAVTYKRTMMRNRFHDVITWDRFWMLCLSSNTVWGHLQSIFQRKDEHNTIYMQLTSTTHIRSVTNRITASLTNDVIHSHKQSLSIFLIALYPCAITRDTAIILSYSCNGLTPIWKRRTICIMLPTHVKPGYYSSWWNAIHIAMITRDDKQQNTVESLI